jgi:hypothetical protein
MGTFKLEIELGNSAMLTAEDLADVLENIADRVRREDEGKIRDLNGNTVGWFRTDDSKT